MSGTTHSDMTVTDMGQEGGQHPEDDGMDKEEILKNLTRARTRLLAAVTGLAEAEMTTLPISEEWTIREVLAHVGGWAAWDLGANRAIQDGDSPDLSVIVDVDQFNEHLVTERSGWSLHQILAELEETSAAIQGLVRATPERDMKTSRFQGPFWSNLAEWLQVAWEHEEEHALQIEAWCEKRSFRQRHRAAQPREPERRE